MPISKIKTSSILADAASTNLNIDAGTLFLDATNNRVGIGQTSPTQILHLTGSSTAYGLAETTGTGTSSGFRMKAGASADYTLFTTQGGNQFAIYDNAAGSQRLTLNSAGNVGIGTTTIGTKLVVADTGQSLVGTAYNVVDFTNAGQTLGTRIGYDSSNGAVIASAGVDKPIAFWQYNTSNYVERMRIDSSGNLLLGATSLPTGGGKLVVSSSAAETKVNIVNTGTGGIHYWIGSTNNSSGAVGGGKFAIYDQTTDNTRLAIDSSGNVGIGTTAPYTPLQVAGTIKIAPSNTTGVLAFGGNAQSATQLGIFRGAANSTSGGNFLNMAGYEGLTFSVSAADIGSQTERMRIDSSGNFFVGSTTGVDSSKMQVVGVKAFSSGIPQGQLNVADSTAYAAGVGGAIAFGGKYHSAGFYTTYASIEGVKENSTDGHYDGNLVFRVRSNGGDNVERMRIGAIDNTIRIYSGTSGSSPALVFGSETSAAKKAIFLESFWLVLQGHNNEGIRFQTTNGAGTITTRMTIGGGGAVSVNGSLSKGSGSFRIEHPLPEKSETHELVHSFIEGPQADLIYRGKVNLVAGTATVNIDTVSDMTQGTFEVLCRDVQCFTTNESDWTAVRGSVTGNILTIEAQDNTSTASISWMVIGERKDKHMYDTGWTDDDGKVIVEPLKVDPEEIPPTETE